jgi:hypothetical protein
MYKSTRCNNASLPRGSDVEQFYIIKTFVLKGINHPFPCSGWEQEQLQHSPCILLEMTKMDAQCLGVQLAHPLSRSHKYRGLTH